MPSISRKRRLFAAIASIAGIPALFGCESSSNGISAPTGQNGPAFAGTHTLVADTAGSGTSPMVTPAVTTPVSGSLILVQVLTQSTNTFRGLSDNKGNKYISIRGAQAYARNNVAGSYLYAAENAVGGAGHTWSLTKTTGLEDNEASMFVIVFPPNPAPRAVGATSYSNTGRRGGTAITTTAPNSDVVSFFGPADYSGSVNDYTPPSGWIRLDQVPYSNDHNSGASAVIVVPANGTTIDPTWRADHWFESGASFWLVEIK
jgi:hypothetical protein